MRWRPNCMRDPVLVGDRVRPEERCAEEVLRRVLGIEITQRDDGSSHRMVDALFHLPDGRDGALEVTTIGEREALEREALAARNDWRVDGSSWAWIIHVGRGVIMRDLERHLSALVLACEQAGAADPRRIPFSQRQNHAFEWFDESDISMHGFRETSSPGAIDVLPDGGGGAVFEHLDELPSWLTQRLAQADLVENVDKLRSSGRAELHLFLRVHETAMPFSLYYPLASGDCVPGARLAPPDGLTGLWLAPAWSNPILWWSAGAGWRRENCLDTNSRDRIIPRAMTACDP